jgi:hypothetical protein
MLFFLHHSMGNVQLRTEWQSSLPVSYVIKWPSLLFPSAVFLNDCDIAALPVYHLTISRNHDNLVLTNALEIDCRIEPFLFECLLAYLDGEPITDEATDHANIFSPSILVVQDF